MMIREKDYINLKSSVYFWSIFAYWLLFLLLLSLYAVIGNSLLIFFGGFFYAFALIEFIKYLKFAWDNRYIIKKMSWFR